MTFDEIEIASARYEYDEAVKKRGVFDSLTNGEYRTAKKKLRAVEKKYDLERTI